MEKDELLILQAASKVLSERRPEPHCAKLIRAYADANLPTAAGLPLDELATVVALKLMSISPDSLLK